MAKARRTKRRIGLRDRLGQLTYNAACRLMGDDDGDVVIGASDYGETLDRGEAYVVFGAPDIEALGPIELGTFENAAGVTMLGFPFGDNTGLSVAGGGDVNADGYDDVLVGAWRGRPLTLNDLPERRRSGLT